MGILDSGQEEPRSKTLRYAVSGVALVILLGASMAYMLRYAKEKHTVERFMDAVIAGDTQKACEIWHTHASFSCQDFNDLWGPKGYYSPIKSYRMESAEVPKGGSGVVVTVELSAYAPFPKPEETVKFAQNREVQIWVEISDQSLSFPPP